MSERAPLSREVLEHMRAVFEGIGIPAADHAGLLLIDQSLAYLDLRDRIEALADEVDSEPTAVREPATSVQIGRAQVSDEIRALLREPLDPQDNTEDV